MKIIFLDIDGVLNNNLDSQYYSTPSGRHLFSKTLVQKLNKLIDETGAKVVVSSTWRLGETVESLQVILNSIGCKCEVVGRTDRLNNGYVFRGNEIYKWIKDNVSILGVKYYYDFKSYVILDDDTDMLLWQVDNFVNTNGQLGLTDSDVEMAKEILNSNK